jgi:hypothetical protein
MAHNYASGLITFGPEADLEMIAKVFSELVQAFCPPGGLRVRVSRGKRTEVLGSRFSQTASISATQLSKGGSVELTAGADFDQPAKGMPLFWITSDPEAEEIAVRIGFCIVKPPSGEAERAVAHAISTIMEVASDVGGCLSAEAAAQPDYTALVDEEVTETGWRTLVSKEQMKSLKRPPPDGVTLERCKNGLLVKVDTPSPWSPIHSSITRWLEA